MTTPPAKLGSAGVGRYVAILPLIAALIALGFGFWLSDHLHASHNWPAYGAFFGAVSQIIAATVIALAIEARLVQTALPLAVGTVIYISVGEVAGVGGLLPGFGSTVYQWLFAFTIAGGVGAVLTVVLIAFQAIRSELQDRLKSAREGI